MSYNGAGNSAYNYADTFPSAGTFTWFVNCTNSLGLRNLSTTDDIVITVQPVPEFGEWTLIIAILGGMLGIRYSSKKIILGKKAIFIYIQDLINSKKRWND